MVVVIICDFVFEGTFQDDVFDLFTYFLPVYTSNKF